MKRGAVLLLLARIAYAGQTLEVTIIDRMESAVEYNMVLPGTSTTSSRADANCSGGATSANCTGTATSNTVSRPTIAGRYAVAGMTLALALPDNRIAIVVCGGKSKFTGGMRSCRVPTIDKIRVDFDGSNAKLIWPAGIDPKKTESETYKITKIIPPEKDGSRKKGHLQK